jgi:ADP-ribose pyrophosphatase
LVEQTVFSEQIYDGRAIKLRVDTVEKPNGDRTTREIVEHSDCVAVVVLDADNNAVMVRQFRKAIDRIILEIPAGGIDNGEQPVDCVRREMQEEIGFIPGKIQRLGGFYSAPGYCNEYLYLYLATQLEPSRLEAEDTDDIEVVKVPLKQIPDLISSGDICDSKSIAGLMWVIYLGLKGDQ